ncbi:MAG: shikimate kinase [Flavobacteriaceae bacterium]|nr:shikimate kinase [Flavobacteriaceae bacterium]
MRIFLIGYMGAGKSTLGKQLAQSLCYDFCDLDAYIEQKNQCKITAFFEKYGEKAFREEESACLKKLCSKENAVISVGGGTPCFNENMDLMNKNGKTIFINPPIDFLIKRLQYRTAHRPLLANKSHSELVDFITKNHKERVAFYQQSQHQIQGQNIKVEDLLPFFN